MRNTLHSGDRWDRVWLCSQSSCCSSSLPFPLDTVKKLQPPPKGCHRKHARKPSSLEWPGSKEEIRTSRALADCIGLSLHFGFSSTISSVIFFTACSLPRHTPLSSGARRPLTKPWAQVKPPPWKLLLTVMNQSLNSTVLASYFQRTCGTQASCHLLLQVLGRSYMQTPVKW